MEIEANTLVEIERSFKCEQASLLKSIFHITYYSAMSTLDNRVTDKQMG